MSTDRRRKAERILEEALSLPPQARLRWLEAACGLDPDLRGEVEELLAVRRLAGDAPPAGAPRPDTAERRTPPERIGPYRVLEELGRGGMGVVHRAERADGQFERSVAIKLLGERHHAEELQARFTAERHILASLDHPNIAQLLDAGVTGDHRPYLVMEYVDGVPLTTYCDRHRLDLRARLRLFGDVCAAVHHAHRNLVIHRDLKPSNVLVTQDGVVKLLDFGIAKLQEADGEEGRLPVTRMRAGAMTPEYASPEQARGDALSTASDVYALGVILYELLVGRRPLDLSSIPPGWIAEVVSGRVPARPSAALGLDEPAGETPRGARLALDEVADRRATTPERLRRALLGDLDAITTKALRKLPAERYGSAELFAEDVRRHLEGHPVHAHEGGRRYLMAKFLRRHRAMSAVAAVATLAVLAGAGVALWQASVADRARDRAEAARAEAERALDESRAVTSFLLELFESSDPEESASDDVTARELLRRGVGRIEELSGEPLVQARVLDAVARVYRSLGRLDDARSLLEQALVQRRATLGPEDPEVARTLGLLADVSRRQGRYAEAEERATEALRIQERALGPEDLEVARTLAQLSGLAIYRGDVTSAEDLSRRALAIRETNPATADSMVAASLVHLSSVIRRLGKNDEAEANLRRALEINRTAYGAEDVSTIWPMRSLAFLYADVGRLDEAEQLVRESMALQLRVSGSGSPSYAYLLGDLGDILASQGRHQESIEMYERELELLRRIFGPEHQAVATIIGRLSAEYALVGELDRAEAWAREALDLTARSSGEEHQIYGDLSMNLADILWKKGSWAEAERAARRAVSIRSKANGPNTKNVGVLRASLGSMLLERRRFLEAQVEMEAALSILEQSLVPEEEGAFQAVLLKLDSLYTAWGRPEEAARVRARLHRR